MSPKKWFGKTDAARVGVVEIKIRLEEFAFLRESPPDRAEILRFAQDDRLARRTRVLADGRSEIAPVAHQKQRGDRFQCMQQSKHARLLFTDGEGQRRQQRPLQRDPIGRGVHFVFRQFELAVTDGFVGEEFDFLESDDLRSNQNVSMRMYRSNRSQRFFFLYLLYVLYFLCLRTTRRRRNFQHPHLRVPHRVRVIVHIHALHVGFAFFEVEMLDVELQAAVQINRFFVDKDQRAGKINLADDVRLAGDINSHKSVARHGAQADGVRRISFVRPVIVCSCEMKKTGCCESRAKIRQIYVPNLYIRGTRQLKRRALQVIYKNFQIVRLNERVLRG